MFYPVCRCCYGLRLRLRCSAFLIPVCLFPRCSRLVARFPFVCWLVTLLRLRLLRLLPFDFRVTFRCSICVTFGAPFLRLHTLYTPVTADCGYTPVVCVTVVYSYVATPVCVVTLFTLICVLPFSLTTLLIPLILRFDCLRWTRLPFIICVCWLIPLRLRCGLRCCAIRLILYRCCVTHRAFPAWTLPHMIYGCGLRVCFVYTRFLCVLRLRLFILPRFCWFTLPVALHWTGASAFAFTFYQLLCVATVCYCCPDPVNTRVRTFPFAFAFYGRLVCVLRLRFGCVCAFPHALRLRCVYTPGLQFIDFTFAFWRIPRSTHVWFLRWLFCRGCCCVAGYTPRLPFDRFSFGRFATRLRLLLFGLPDCVYGCSFVTRATTVYVRSYLIGCRYRYYLLLLRYRLPRTLRLHTVTAFGFVLGFFAAFGDAPRFTVSLLICLLLHLRGTPTFTTLPFTLFLRLRFVGCIRCVALLLPLRLLLVLLRLAGCSYGLVPDLRLLPVTLRYGYPTHLRLNTRCRTFDTTLPNVTHWFVVGTPLFPRYHTNYAFTLRITTFVRSVTRYCCVVDLTYTRYVYTAARLFTVGCVRFTHVGLFRLLVCYVYVYARYPRTRVWLLFTVAFAVSCVWLIRYVRLHCFPVDYLPVCCYRLRYVTTFNPFPFPLRYVRCRLLIVALRFTPRLPFVCCVPRVRFVCVVVADLRLRSRLCCLRRCLIRFTFTRTFAFPARLVHVCHDSGSRLHFATHRCSVYITVTVAHTDVRSPHAFTLLRCTVPRYLLRRLRFVACLRIAHVWFTRCWLLPTGCWTVCSSPHPTFITNPRRLRFGLVTRSRLHAFVHVAGYRYVTFTCVYRTVCRWLHAFALRAVVPVTFADVYIRLFSVTFTTLCHFISHTHVSITIYRWFPLIPSCPALFPTLLFAAYVTFAVYPVVVPFRILPVTVYRVAGYWHVWLRPLIFRGYPVWRDLTFYRLIRLFVNVWFTRHYALFNYVYRSGRLHTGSVCFCYSPVDLNRRVRAERLFNTIPFCTRCRWRSLNVHCRLLPFAHVWFGYTLLLFWFTTVWRLRSRFDSCHTDFLTRPFVWTLHLAYVPGLPTLFVTLTFVVRSSFHWWFVVGLV